MKWLLGVATVGMLALALRAPSGTEPRLVQIAGAAVLGAPPEEPRFAVAPPGDAGAVILCAMSRSEWAGYQVRAVAWEATEREMLTACRVSSDITSRDAAEITTSLAVFLKEAVNRV